MKRRSVAYRISVAIAITIAIILALLIIYNETPIKRGTPTLYIPSSYEDDIISTMNKHGYELNSIDRIVMQFVTLPTEGWYRFDLNETGRFSFLQNMHKKKEKSIQIVVFAGDTNREMCHRLANDLDISEKKLIEGYKNFTRFKEGNILAGKYRLAKSVDENTAIKYLIDKSYKELDFFAKDRFGSDFPTEDLRTSIIIASIIQKESNDKDEMSYISSVIRNRLKKNMRLQMDGTLNYGKYSRTVVTPERIKNDTSRYNTYKYKGLPPAPLSIVSMDALEAATFPRETDYIFFMLNKSGKHDFAVTYKEHLANVKTFKEYRRKVLEERRLAKIKEEQEKKLKEKKLQEKKLQEKKLQEKKLKEKKLKEKKLVVEEQKVQNKIETKEQIKKVTNTNEQTRSESNDTERKVRPKLIMKITDKAL